MNDVDWTAAIPVFALSLVVTVVFVVLACVWAERRETRRMSREGFNANARLK